MAATLLQQYQSSLDGTLRARVNAAVQRVANQVRVEPANQPYPATTPLGSPMNSSRSAKRQALVIAIKGMALQSYVDCFTRSVVDAAGVQNVIVYGVDGSGNVTTDTGAVTDAQIMAQVAQAWDVISGVLPSEIP